MMKLAGGDSALLAVAQQATADGDHQWAMELSDHLIVADKHTQAAKIVKVTALRALADLEINAVGRNYYLVSAQEIEQTLT